MIEINLKEFTSFNKNRIDDRELLVYAHSSKNGTNELYLDHITKIQKILSYLVSHNVYSSVIQSLYDDVRSQSEGSSSIQELISILDEMVHFHDIGKFNPLFQRDRLKISEYSDLNIPAGISTHHSFISGFYFLLYLVNQKKINEENDLIFLILSYIILGHHSNLKSPIQNKLIDLGGEYKEYQRTVHYLQEDIFKIPKDEYKKIFRNIQRYYKDTKSKLANFKNTASISLFNQLIYSLFNISDIHAAINSDILPANIQFKDELPINRISNHLKNSIIKNYGEYQKKFSNPQTELNIARKDMFDIAQKKLDQGLERNKKLFFLKMPTGGGKTNTSLGLALKIIEQTSVDRIIYALPYINLIDQNHNVISKTLGVEEGKTIRKLYSGSVLYKKDDDEFHEIVSDDELFNYPIITTTTVRLFDVITNSNKKSKLQPHQLVNSVIIIDEIQSLPIRHWPTIVHLLKSLAEYYNTYFILMSATFPNLDEIVLYDSPIIEKKFLQKLIPNPQAFYDIFNRNQVKSLREYDIENNPDLLINDLIDIINSNADKRNTRGLLVFNTIATSRLIYSLLTESDELGNFQILLLNGTILEYKRNEIIEIITNTDNLILVSTQSIEAGIDVDFDYVVRDIAILDSIEQVRGRCNREIRGEAENFPVYLVRIKGKYGYDYSIYQDSSDKYTGEVRLMKTLELLEQSIDYNYNNIEQYYKQLTNEVNNHLSQRNRYDEAKNIQYFNLLDYDSFQFELIPNQTISFFITTSIPKSAFRLEEIQYLLRKGVNIQNYVKAEDILQLYRQEFQNVLSSKSFKEIKQVRKEMEGILRHFVINVYTSISRENLKDKFEKLSYFYIIPHDDVGPSEIYDVNLGLNKEGLKE